MFKIRLNLSITDYFFHLYLLKKEDQSILKLFDLQNMIRETRNFSSDIFNDIVLCKRI